MTDDLGTLAGLIADLEELHPPYDQPQEGQVCLECSDSREWVTWPCPTIELTRKHKQAQYEIRGMDGGNLWVNKIWHDIDADPLFQSLHANRAECEAWIEAQVNGE